MTRSILSRRTIAAALAAAAFAGGVAAEPAGANNTTASATCLQATGWVVAWPFHMQRTPGFESQWIASGGSIYPYREYTEQRLYFRVWVNGYAGAWITSTGEMGAGANPLGTWVEVQPGVWRQSVIYPAEGAGPEDVSFFRLPSSWRARYHEIWFEFCWMPIYVMGTGQMAYAGYHTKIKASGSLYC
jgi:hypothetical protein